MARRGHDPVWVTSMDESNSNNTAKSLMPFLYVKFSLMNTIILYADDDPICWFLA
jgi:hypothetical protein